MDKEGGSIMQYFIVTLEDGTKLEVEASCSLYDVIYQDPSEHEVSIKVCRKLLTVDVNEEGEIYNPSIEEKEFIEKEIISQMIDFFNGIDEEYGYDDVCDL